MNRPLSLALLLPALLSVRASAGEPPWVFQTQVDGLAVYDRATPGSVVHEVKAQGLVDSPPAACWAVLRDVGAYAHTMPFTKSSRVIGEEPGGKVVYYYTELDFPVLSNRDYSLKVTADHTPEDGSGIYRIPWTIANDYPKAPPQQPHIVRLKDVSGYWELSPQKNGRATHVEYYVHSDPESPLPAFLLNKANHDVVPKVINSLREWAKKAPYAQPK